MQGSLGAGVAPAAVGVEGGQDADAVRQPLAVEGVLADDLRRRGPGVSEGWSVASHVTLVALGRRGGEVGTTQNQKNKKRGS